MGSDENCADGYCTCDTGSANCGGTSSYVDVNNFDPTNCNSVNNCYPLRQAKDAAKLLVNTLYDQYDRVAVVTFDYYGRLQYGLNSNLGDDDGAADGDAFAAIDGIQLHDDAPFGRLWANWQTAGKVNLVNPEDRDGDGEDADPAIPCTDDPFDKWDDTLGVPCDLDNQLDSYDWNGDGQYTCGGRRPWHGLPSDPGLHFPSESSCFAYQHLHRLRHATGYRATPGQWPARRCVGCSVSV
jgi:hypothetical protein